MTAMPGWDPRVPLSPLLPEDPTSFGSYRVLGRLGAGGLGEAFLAQDGATWAVVKAVRPGVEGMASLRARMAREVSAMQRIHSPRIARVLAADVDAPRPWFAMEFVPGVTLERAVAEDGPLAGPILLGLARQLALALDEVHRAGVVHRDLKPANVMWTPAGPQLIDFGIASVAEGTRLTATGSSLGTMFWMSPEQVTGDQATSASDVHAWGLLVLFAAMGRPPFNGENSVAAMYQVLNVAPNVPADLPYPLADVVSRAVEKNPARRPSLAEILADLPEQGAQPTVAMPAVATPFAPGPARGYTPQYPLEGQYGQQPAPGQYRQPLAPGQYPSTPAPMGAIPNTSPIPNAGVAVQYGRPPKRKGPVIAVVAVILGLLVVGAGAFAAFGILGDPNPDSSPTADASPTASDTPTESKPTDSGEPSDSSTPTQETPPPSPPPTPTQPPATPAPDLSGAWTGTSTAYGKNRDYQIDVELDSGSTENPTGTVTMTNLTSGNTGAWATTGHWEGSELVLEPGDWLQQPNSSWTKDVIRLVPVDGGALSGTTANQGTPDIPTGSVDLRRR